MATLKSKRTAAKRKSAKKVSRTATATVAKVGRKKKEKEPTHPVLHKDHRYLTVNGVSVPKSRVAVEILSRFVEKKKIKSIEDVLAEFPKELHPAGLIVPVAEARRKNAKRTRFNMTELLTFGGKKFAINKEFGHNNMTPLIKAAEKNGFKVQRVIATKTKAVAA